MEPVAVWKRAPLAFAIVLLLVGAAAGFGIGYSVGDSGGQSTSKVAKSPRTAGPAARQKQTQVQVQATHNRLVACLANHGVRWPKTQGGPKIGKPPPGVDEAKYKAAVEACYFAVGNTRNAKKTVPPG